MQYNYSIIIPHHNCPRLLKRCLDSIPQREDTEIIVVDDNSDADKKPLIEREDVKLVSLMAQESRGAGHARNVGMEKAEGKWIVFSDADDYFVPNILNALDNVINSNLDVIYFPALSVDNDTMESLPHLLSSQNRCFEDYNGDKYAADVIKFRLHSPWWKIVRHDFIKEYHILFEAVPKGNDIFFSYQVGYFAKNITVEKRPLYVHTYNRHGISYGKKNLNIRVSSLIQRYKMNKFYAFIGYPKWKKSILGYLYEVLKYDGLLLFMQTLTYLFCHLSYVKKSEDDYVTAIKEKNKNTD